MKTLIKSFALLASLASAVTLFAQGSIYVCKKDGTYVEYAISDIDSVSMNKPESQEIQQPVEKTFFLYRVYVDYVGTLHYNLFEIVGHLGFDMFAYS